MSHHFLVLPSSMKIQQHSIITVYYIFILFIFLLFPSVAVVVHLVDFLTMMSSINRLFIIYSLY